MKFMTPAKLISGALLLFSAAGCSLGQTPESETASIETAKHEHASISGIETVKPGPDVQISTELREQVLPGGTGALNITFSEQYPTGTMRVKASTSDGLELFTTIDQADFDMSKGGEHEWTVYFRANDAGRQYVNFHVSVDTPFGPLTRSSSAVIQIGGAAAIKANDPSDLSMTTDVDGKPVIMMQAQETIIAPEN